MRSVPDLQEPIKSYPKVNVYSESWFHLPDYLPSHVPCLTEKRERIVHVLCMASAMDSRFMAFALVHRALPPCDSITIIHPSL